MVAVFHRQIEAHPVRKGVPALKQSVILLLRQSIYDPHIRGMTEGETKDGVLLSIFVINPVSGCLPVRIQFLAAAIIIQKKLPFVSGALHGIDELSGMVRTADGNISHVSGTVIFQADIVNIILLSVRILPVSGDGAGKAASAVGKNGPGIQILHIIVHGTAIGGQHLFISGQRGFQTGFLFGNNVFRMAQNGLKILFRFRFKGRKTVLRISIPDRIRVLPCFQQGTERFFIRRDGFAICRFQILMKIQIGIAVLRLVRLFTQIFVLYIVDRKQIIHKIAGNQRICIGRLRSFPEKGEKRQKNDGCGQSGCNCSCQRCACHGKWQKIRFTAFPFCIQRPTPPLNISDFSDRFRFFP